MFRALTSRQAVIIVLLAVTILLPRIFDLGAFMTADEKIWLANTTGFTRNLALFKWDHLLQQPHPGLTTNWLGAPAIHAESLAVQKLPLVITQSLLIGAVGYIFYRLWGYRAGALLALLLALNPFLIAHTRVYAMDSLLAIFLLLSLGCLLLWRKTDTGRYLVFAAAAGALAVLSKLPGVIIVPFSLLLLTWWQRKQPDAAARIAKATVVYLAAFLGTLIIVFPSLALNFTEVTHLIKEFLLEGDAQDTHGPVRATYYLETLLFFSTPLHLITLAALPFVWQRIKNKENAAILLAFAALFTLQMALGAKQGDRYILPSFLFLDALVVAVFVTVINQVTRRSLLCTVYCVLATLLVWQAFDVARLHPHTLAYVNPVTKPFYDDRRLGWGEGLDLAAQYVNQQPNAAALKVAAPYPSEFAYNFAGEVIPLNHYRDANADYVIVYRSLFERGESAWETSVLNQFAGRSPEKIITLNGLPYVWIYVIQ